MTTRTIIALPEHCDSVALCGGPYSNFGAVEAFLAATTGEPRFCLGDLGGFGPHPDRTIALLRAAGVVCLQGNYDHAVGHDERDCGCGYVDPRDREFAQISFDYTAANTSDANKAWLRTLPPEILVEWRGQRILLVHGSPDSVNAFVWASETTDARIDAWLGRERVDGICATHSGVPWLRETRRGFWCNVGVLGRPAMTVRGASAMRACVSSAARSPWSWRRSRTTSAPWLARCAPRAFPKRSRNRWNAACGRPATTCCRPPSGGPPIAILLR